MGTSQELSAVTNRQLLRHPGFILGGHRSNDRSTVLRCAIITLTLQLFPGQSELWWGISWGTPIKYSCFLVYKQFLTWTKWRPTGRHDDGRERR